MTMSRMSLLILRGLGLTALLGFLLCALTSFPNHTARWLTGDVATTGAEAIVVLGADLRTDGSLGDSSLRRTLAGLEQYKKGAAPLILFLGSAREGVLTESVVRRRLAHQFGVPDAAILGDDGARTTREEAERARAVLGPRDVKSILVVSDSLHLRRARYVFEREGFQVSAVAADTIALDAGAPEERLKLARAVAQQAMALLVYRLRG